MPYSRRIISEMLSDIPIVGKYDFLKPMIHFQLIQFPVYPECAAVSERMVCFDKNWGSPRRGAGQCSLAPRK